MSLESHVKAIAESLAEQSAATLNQHSLRRHYDSQDIARGIEASGLGQSLVDGLEDVRESLIGVGALLGADLQQLSLDIGLSNRRLEAIEHALRNPLGTAAQERFTRGTRAFNRGWLPEALDEFAAAVEDDPYLAVAHLMQALSLLQSEGSEEMALASLLKAFRYGTPDEPAIATGAALLAVRVHQRLDAEGAAAALASQAVERFPNCPELVLLRTELNGDPKTLARALAFAPELVTVAALKVPTELARMASEPNGEHLALIASAKRISGLSRAVLEDLPNAVLDATDLDCITATVPDDSSVAALLTACRVHVRSRAVRDRLRDQSDEFRRKVDRSRLDAELALRRSAWRRAEIERLSAPTPARLAPGLSSRLHQAERDLQQRQGWIDKNGSWASPATLKVEHDDLERKKAELAAVRAEAAQAEELARLKQLEANKSRIDELTAEEQSAGQLVDPDEDPIAEARQNLLLRLGEEVARFPLPGRVIPFVGS